MNSFLDNILSTVTFELSLQLLVLSLQISYQRNIVVQMGFCIKNVSGDSTSDITSSTGIL